MGAPHTDLGAAICKACEALHTATAAMIEDTITGLNRNGMPFKAIHREDLEVMRQSADFVKGFIAAQDNNEEAKFEFQYLYDKTFEV